MENYNTIQINKFSHLHNGVDIIFCKTDYILSEFEYIRTLPNDVILITGNSDYPITDYHVNLSPKNIKKWFAQNALSNNEILEPLPIGLENKLFSHRDGHGIGYEERVRIKESLLSRNLNVTPTKNFYSNFTINTNYNHRNEIKNICENSPHIDWDEPNLSYKDFFDKILDYECVICPAGNGVDTHRLWEVLYSKRIPITIKIGNYQLYKIYEMLPIIILDDINQLNDEDFLKQEIIKVKNKQINLNLLDTSFWVSKIKNIITNEIHIK